MELLLILSALLTGLTGAFADDRRDARPQVQTAGVAAASVGEEALIEAAASLLQRPASPLPALVEEASAPTWAVLPAPKMAPAGASERRLE